MFWIYMAIAVFQILSTAFFASYGYRGLSCWCLAFAVWSFVYAFRSIKREGG